MNNRMFLRTLWKSPPAIQNCFFLCNQVFICKLLRLQINTLKHFKGHISPNRKQTYFISIKWKHKTIIQPLPYKCSNTQRYILAKFQLYTMLWNEPGKFNFKTTNLVSFYIKCIVTFSYFTYKICIHRMLIWRYHFGNLEFLGHMIFRRKKYDRRNDKHMHIIFCGSQKFDDIGKK